MSKSEEPLIKLKKNHRFKELSLEYQKILEGYAIYMKKDQLSGKTIERGFYMAGRFLAFLEKINFFQIGTVTRDIINTFLTSISMEPSRFNKPISASFLTDYYIHIKKLFRFLHEEKVILVNPADRIGLPKKETVLPRNILTGEEIIKLLDQPNTKTIVGIRNRAILELLYGCGLRSGEVQRLKIEDVDLKNGYIHIKNSKGAKDRIIPIGENAALWLGKYIALRCGIKPELKELFLSTYYNRPVCDSCLHEIIKRYSKKAGISKHITPHSIRHTYATHLLQQGAPLRHIQALLGHSTLDSTQIYTHVAIQEVKKAHAQNHPRDKLNPLVSQINLDNSQFLRKIEPRKKPVQPTEKENTL